MVSLPRLELSTSSMPSALAQPTASLAGSGKSSSRTSFVLLMRIPISSWKTKEQSERNRVKGPKGKERSERSRVKGTE